MVIWRMIRWFFYYLLRDYDDVMAFMEWKPKLKEQAVRSGEYADWYSSRWRFAWKMICVEWKHRDRLRNVRFGGDCANCKAKR
jgi:hypothetical protein